MGFVYGCGSKMSLLPNWYCLPKVVHFPFVNPHGAILVVPKAELNSMLPFFVFKICEWFYQINEWLDNIYKLLGHTLLKIIEKIRLNAILKGLTSDSN